MASFLEDLKTYLPPVDPENGDTFRYLTREESVPIFWELMQTEKDYHLPGESIAFFEGRSQPDGTVVSTWLTPSKHNAWLDYWLKVDPVVLLRVKEDGTYRSIHMIDRISHDMIYLHYAVGEFSCNTKTCRKAYYEMGIRKIRHMMKEEQYRRIQAYHDNLGEHDWIRKLSEIPNAADLFETETTLEPS